MRVLFLTTNNGLMDGINRHILAVARGLAKRNDLEIGVCTVFPKGELHEQLEPCGVRVYALNGRHGHGCALCWRFLKVLRDFKPDLVHVHVLAFMERLVLSIFYARLPIVTTIHGLNGIQAGIAKAGIRDKVMELLARTFKLNQRARICISKGVYDKLGISRLPTYVVSNPVDFSGEYRELSTSDLRAELGIATDSIVIGTACRIAEVKSPIAFTHVLAEVLRKFKYVHAVVCGDGPLRIDCEAVVREKYPETVTRFHFLGYRSDAAWITAQLNCFVMTSYTEGMPTALLEAVSFHVPVAFMRGEGGLVDLAELHEESGPIGIVVDQGDVEAMARRICELIKMPSIGMEYASRAYEVCSRRFSIDAVVSKISEVYERAC